MKTTGWIDVCTFKIVVVTNRKLYCLEKILCGILWVLIISLKGLNKSLHLDSPLAQTSENLRDIGAGMCIIIHQGPRHSFQCLPSALCAISVQSNRRI